MSAALPPSSPGPYRLVLPLVAFLFAVIALGVAVYVAFAPGATRQAGAVGGAFRLVDQNGKLLSEAALQGGPSLVFFGFTHCPDICPTTLFEVSKIYEALGPRGDRLKTFFVTVDPERDTPAVLKDYLSSFDPRIVGLTGDPSAVDAATKAFRVYARKVPQPGGGYTMDHTALVYLMDRQGRFVGGFNLQRPAAEAASDLRKYL